MLFRGIGSNHSPDVPFVDEALGRGMQRRGFKGSRKRGECVFTATRQEHAAHYVGKSGTLLVATPLPGSVLTIVRGSTDLVLEFGMWLGDARFGGLGTESRGLRSLVSDIAGDTNVLDTYLALGRQKQNAVRLVDLFLSELHIDEIEVTDDIDLGAFLQDHDGEAWVTGPCHLEPLPRTDHGHEADAPAPATP